MRKSRFKDRNTQAVETPGNSAQKEVKDAKNKVKVSGESRCGWKEEQDGKRPTLGSLENASRAEENGPGFV